MDTHSARGPAGDVPARASCKDTTTHSTTNQQGQLTRHTPDRGPPQGHSSSLFPDRIPNEIRNLVLDVLADARFVRPDMAFRIVVGQGYDALQPRVPDRFVRGETQQPVPANLPSYGGIAHSEAHARVLAHRMAQVDRFGRDRVFRDAASSPVVFSLSFAAFDTRASAKEDDALANRLLRAPPMANLPVRSLFPCAQPTVLVDYTDVTNRSSIFQAIHQLLALPTELPPVGACPLAVPGALGEFRMRSLMLHHRVDLGTNAVVGRRRRYFIGGGDSESRLLLDRLDHDGSFAERGLRPDGWVVGNWHQLDLWMGQRRAIARATTFAEEEARAFTLTDGTRLVEWARVSRSAPFDLAVLEVVDGSQISWRAFVLLAFGFLRWRLYVLARFAGSRQRTRGIWDRNWESVSLMCASGGI